MVLATKTTHIINETSGSEVLQDKQRFFFVLLLFCLVISVSSSHEVKSVSISIKPLLLGTICSHIGLVFGMITEMKSMWSS